LRAVVRYHSDISDSKLIFRQGSKKNLNSHKHFRSSAL